jgi:hypothetical protein
MIAADWHEDPKVATLGRESSTLYRLQAAAQFGRTQEAIATVEAMTKGDDPHIYALAAGAVKGDAALPDRYAARAVTLLKQAVTTGYKDGDSLLKDPDLDALRRRKDFAQLLWDLADTR